MEVILLERIAKLGQMGDVVNVKDGFARNFLLPQKKAMRATAQSLAHFKKAQATLEARNIELRSEAEKTAARMTDVKVTILRQASDSGQLYGSVTARDIANALTDDGYLIERRQVRLISTIKKLGIFEAEGMLHPEVSVVVKVNVARSQAEAEAQAYGDKSTTEKNQEEKKDEQLTVSDEFFETDEAAARARQDIEGVTGESNLKDEPNPDKEI